MRSKNGLGSIIAKMCWKNDPRIAYFKKETRQTDGHGRIHTVYYVCVENTKFWKRTGK